MPFKSFAASQGETISIAVLVDGVGVGGLKLTFWPKFLTDTSIFSSDRT